MRGAIYWGEHIGKVVYGMTGAACCSSGQQQAEPDLRSALPRGLCARPAQHRGREGPSEVEKRPPPSTQATGTERPGIKAICSAFIKVKCRPQAAFPTLHMWNFRRPLP